MTAPFDPEQSDWRHLVVDLLRRVQSELHEALGEASGPELDQPLAAGLNPPGWLAWHLTRSHDRNLSEIAGLEQLWLAERWNERFHRTADPNDTGFQHTAEEVAAFASPSGLVILAYHDAVVGRAVGYLESAPEHDLDRVASSPTLMTAHSVQKRLVGVLNEAFQHLGQIRLSRQSNNPRRSTPQ